MCSLHAPMASQIINQSTRLEVLELNATDIGTRNAV